MSCYVCMRGRKRGTKGGREEKRKEMAYLLDSHRVPLRRKKAEAEEQEEVKEKKF